MKTRPLIAVAFLISVLGRLAASDAPKILHDVGHGQVSLAEPMKPIITRLGVEWVEGKGPIDAAGLKGVRLLYLRAPSQPFLPAEKESIVQFVRSGGSLLLVMDEERRQSLATVGADDLIVPFGLKLTPDLPYLHNTGALAKAGAIHRADREIPYSGGRAVEGGMPFAFVLDREGKPAQAMAASTIVPGGGRVVVLAEAMATLLVAGKAEGVRLTGVPRDARNTTYWGKDSVAFMEEVIAWLVQR